MNSEIWLFMTRELQVLPPRETVRADDQEAGSNGAEHDGDPERAGDRPTGVFSPFLSTVARTPSRR
jgi:hypothetical protein